MSYGFPVISADSHITEHPDTYIANIDAKWRDKAPRMVDGGEKGDLFVIDGMDRPIAMGLVAAAGKPPEALTETGVRFEELHRSGWDPKARRGANGPEHAPASTWSFRSSSNTRSRP